MIIMKTLFKLLLCFCLSTNLLGQDDCATAMPLSIGISLASTNAGSTPDNNYSAQTGCPSVNYNSSVWFAFTTSAGMGSVNITFTSGTIGPTALLTLVDDCSTATSFSFIYDDCNPPSGTSTTICGLEPSSTYYIQISSSSGMEGTFDLLVDVNPNSPTNDLCENALPIPGGPTLLCLGGFSSIVDGDPLACPDSEATGCMSNSTPGVWSYVDVPRDYEDN
jgi:hypothetical protein